MVYNKIGEAGMSYFTTKSGEGRAVEAKNSGLTNVITGPQIAICITIQIYFYTSHGSARRKTVIYCYTNQVKHVIAVYDIKLVYT